MNRQVILRNCILVSCLLACSCKNRTLREYGPNGQIVREETRSEPDQHSVSVLGKLADTYLTTSAKAAKKKRRARRRRR